MGIRTPGLVIANDALYQLSYTPKKLGDSVAAPAGHFKRRKRVWFGQAGAAMPAYTMASEHTR